MRLPELGAQALYLDLGWAVVLSALLLSALAGRGEPLAATRRRAIGVVAFVGAAVLLPGAWSPAYWLGMAFQHPSWMLVMLAALHIHRFMQPRADDAPLLGPWPAATLLAIALALYAGAFGWWPDDLYALGHAPFADAAAATALVVLWASVDRRSGRACGALAAAALLHAATRLPSGNAWDALLDPFVAGWAAVVLLRSARARFRPARAQRA